MNKKMMSVCCLALVVFITGCETIKGIGKDVENTGQNIQEALSKGQ